MDPDSGIIRVHSRDGAEHSALLEPWDLRINQVSPGAFSGTVDAIRTPTMVVYEEFWGQATAVRGSTPPGYVMFGTAFGPSRARASWCGAELGYQTFACAGPSSEITVEAPRKSHQVVLLVQPETLARGLGDEWRDLLSSRKSFDLISGPGRLLCEQALRTVRQHVKRPELLSRPGYVRSLESDLLGMLIRCTASVDRSRPASQSARDLALRTAMEVAASRRGRITALELSTAAGVSQRTLEYAFRARLGTTPGRYLRSLRLEEAHWELMAADPGTSSVSWIASNWGFYHLGRFSARYREQFAELPSQTLRTRRPPLHPVLADLIGSAPA